MVKLGYKLMAEEHGPAALVRNTVRAEQAGFGFAAISDHFFPWLDEQGHAPFAWSVLGAAAQATRQIQLMTAVTCPIMRYHPAIIAQGAATMAVLSENRFILGLGAGERLNEHVIARAGPASGSGTSAFPRRTTSSAGCSMAASRTTVASTSRSTTPSCTTAPNASPRLSAQPADRRPPASQGARPTG